MNAANRTRRQRHNAGDFYVDGIPSFCFAKLVLVPCTAAMGVILLCGRCVNVYDALCLPFPSPFHDFLISDSACWGTVPLIFFGRSLRYCYGEYNSIVLCSRLCLVSLFLSPLFVFPFRFNHNISVFSSPLSFCSLGQVGLHSSLIHCTLFCLIVGQRCLISFLSVDHIYMTDPLYEQALTLRSP